MTTPAPPQQVPPGQQPPPPPPMTPADEAAMVTAIATVLVTAVTVEAAIQYIKLRFKLQGFMIDALSGSLGIAMAHPPPVTGVVGPASAQTSRQNLARRAQFVVSSAKRLMSDLVAWRAKHTGPAPAPPPGPEPPPASAQAADLNLLRRGQFAEARHRRLQADIDAAENAGRMQALQDGLARERRYYSMHVAAMWNRSVAAGKTDMAALEHGDLLGWLAILDDRVSPECAAASGKNYHASAMPVIGYPGSVHPHCRCMPVAPWPGGRLLPSRGRVRRTVGLAS